jgi:hypothetical protein
MVEESMKFQGRSRFGSYYDIHFKETKSKLQMVYVDAWKDVLPH